MIFLKSVWGRGFQKFILNCLPVVARYPFTRIPVHPRKWCMHRFPEITVHAPLNGGKIKGSTRQKKNYMYICKIDVKCPKFHLSVNTTLPKTAKNGKNYYIKGIKG